MKTALAVATAVLATGCATTAAAEPEDPCVAVRVAFDKQLPVIEAAAGAAGNPDYVWASPEFRNAYAVASRIVANAPECYSPADVALAQQALQNLNSYR